MQAGRAGEVGNQVGASETIALGKPPDFGILTLDLLADLVVPPSSATAVGNVAVAVRSVRRVTGPSYADVNAMPMSAAAATASCVSAVNVAEAKAGAAPAVALPVTFAPFAFTLSFTLGTCCTFAGIVATAANSSSALSISSSSMSESFVPRSSS